MKSDTILNEFIEAGKRDLPVYISDVRSAFMAAEGTAVVLDLLRFDGSASRNEIIVPAEPAAAEHKEFVREFLFAEVYNLLSAVGGRRLDIFVDAPSAALRSIFYELPSAFGIGVSRKERSGYGRCVNVIERMLDSQGVPGGFAILIHDMPAPPLPETNAQGALASARFARAFAGIGAKLILGVDIGGTDIKLAASVKGKLCCLKEYDWFPARFTRSHQLYEPVKLLVRLIRARVSCDFVSVDDRLIAALDEAIDKHMPDGAIEKAVSAAEAALGDNISGFDAIGLCFPDVVIRNKIVGGEVFKTRGIRNNPAVEYEAEFKRLTDLDEMLKPYLAPGGHVRITNDGNMAAYTAAIELIAKGEGHLLKDGRFAHTLGTELGTGWIDEVGDIPEIPLEVYNFIIDLGSREARKYPPDDLRSINNFNTGLPGTLQKFMAQNGVFRLAIKASLKSGGKLYREMLEGGYVFEKDGGVFIALEPKDMRKPLLEFLMRRLEEGDAALEEVFREIGRSTGVTFLETEHVLAPKTKERVLYGRLVKRLRCFALICEGAKQAVPGLELSVADEQNAFSDLMLQLKAHPVFTVAQFAQSVGALYFGNMPE